MLQVKKKNPRQESTFKTNCHAPPTEPFNKIIQYTGLVTLQSYSLTLKYSSYKIFFRSFIPSSVFSLNFSSAGKGRFMAGKAQDMCQRHTLMGGGGGTGGSRVRDMARPLL